MRNLFIRIFGDRYDRRMKKYHKLYTKPIEEETFSLDCNFIDFIVPRLELYKEKASKWIVYDFTIIDKILVGFKLYQSVFDWKVEDIEKNMAIVKESMQVFAEHWMELGW